MQSDECGKELILFEKSQILIANDQGEILSKCNGKRVCFGQRSGMI